MAKKPKSSDGSSAFDKAEREYERQMDKLHAGTKKSGPKVNFGYPMSNSPEAKAERLQQYKNKERMKYLDTMYNKPLKSAGEGKGKVKKIRAAKAGGRAQPKGTPPRTGPGSGAGGHGARYSRLTGGGSRHGR